MNCLVVRLHVLRYIEHFADCLDGLHLQSFVYYQGFLSLDLLFHVLLHIPQEFGEEIIQVMWEQLQHFLCVSREYLTLYYNTELVFLILSTYTLDLLDSQLSHYFLVGFWLFELLNGVLKDIFELEVVQWLQTAKPITNSFCHYLLSLLYTKGQLLRC